MNFLARAGGVVLAILGLLTFVGGAAWIVLLVMGAGAAGVAGGSGEEPGTGALAAGLLLMGTMPGIAVAISGMMTAGLGAGLYILADIETHLDNLQELAVNQARRQFRRDAAERHEASEMVATVGIAEAKPPSPAHRTRGRAKTPRDPVKRALLILGCVLVLAVLAVIGYGLLLERRNDARDKERAAEWNRARQADQPLERDGK
jgi:hypothetical protein